MALLIDGYNLLHASGILAPGAGPATLERSRGAMLDFLAESLDAALVARTIVVFDAGVSASGRVRAAAHRGIQVRFSAGKADADDLIEELIRADSAPRRLTVVSSDHRIQRAAHRRKARAIDSDKWFAGVLRSRGELPDEPEPRGASSRGLMAGEVQYWLKRFGIDDPSAGQAAASEFGGADDPAAKELPGRSTKHGPPIDRSPADEPANPLHPFPPGYAEDVEEDE